MKVFLLLGLMAILAGCGKQAPLKAPPGAPSTYPLSYPRS